MRTLRNMSVSIAMIFTFALLFFGGSSDAHAQQAHSATITFTAPSVPTLSNLTFKLQRATASNGPFTQIGNPVAAVTIVDTTVVAGTTYWWRVLSSCPATGAGCGTTTNPINGDSVPSASVTGTVPNDSTAPPPATSLTLTLQ